MIKVIWSSNGELDDLLQMPADQKRLELTNWYDKEMVDQLADDELDKIIGDNVDIFYNEAMEDFEYNIVPMISNQFLGGFVLDENFNVVDPGVLLSDARETCEIYEDDNGDLYWKEEGRKAIPLLGFDEDQDKFIDQLDQLDILSTMHNLYPDQDDEDIEIYDIADLIPFDWTLLGNVLNHAVNNLDVVEELTEAKAKNPNKLSNELAEVVDLADEYGYEYFTQMPFTSYDDDPIAIETQYPELFRVIKSFFKEMELLDDATKEDYINDRYPHGDAPITKDDVTLDNPDVLDYLWDLEDQLSTTSPSDFKHDWDVIIRSCEKLANGKGVQFEKEYKTGYNSALDDDEILANREQNESLNEDAKTSKNGALAGAAIGAVLGTLSGGPIGAISGAIRGAIDGGFIVPTIKDELITQIEAGKWEDTNIECPNCGNGNSSAGIHGLIHKKDSSNLLVCPNCAQAYTVKDKKLVNIGNFNDEDTLRKAQGKGFASQLGSLFQGGARKAGASLGSFEESLNEAVEIHMEGTYDMADLLDAYDDKTGKVHDNLEFIKDLGENKHLYKDDEGIEFIVTDEGIYDELNEDVRFYVDGGDVVDSLKDDRAIGTLYDDGTVELFDAKSVSKADREKIKKDLSNHYYVSFLDENINPELYKPFGHDSYDSGYVYEPRDPEEDEARILPPDADDEDWEDDLDEDNADSLKEDTVTWPWGDPNEELPQKKLPDKTSSDSLVNKLI